MAVEALRSEFLCSLTGLVAPPREIGATPRGTRRFYPAIGGSFEGPRLRGDVLPDAGDWLLMRPDGVLEQDVRITLKTDDGAFIYVRYAGIRHGPPEVMARLAQGEMVDPSEYYFRVAPMFETGAERYAWLNNILAVGVGERLPPNIARYSIVLAIQVAEPSSPVRLGKSARLVDLCAMCKCWPVMPISAPPPDISSMTQTLSAKWLLSFRPTGA
jgi:hypothetical protein